jgi:hypothetical protein
MTWDKVAAMAGAIVVQPKRMKSKWAKGHTKDSERGLRPSRFVRSESAHSIGDQRHADIDSHPCIRLCSWDGDQFFGL